VLLIKVGIEIQRFAGHIMTTPAVSKTLALAASRNLTFTIEGIAVCGNTTPTVIRLLFVFTFTANQAASGFNHTISTPFFAFGILCHYELDNCLSCS